MSLNINGASTVGGFISEDISVPIRGAELFVAGMVNNLLGANDLPRLENCLKASDKIATDVAHIM
jgi:hypothetical protein